MLKKYSKKFSRNWLKHSVALTKRWNSGFGDIERGHQHPKIVIKIGVWEIYLITFCLVTNEDWNHLQKQMISHQVMTQLFEWDHRQLLKSQQVCPDMKNKQDSL